MERGGGGADGLMNVSDLVTSYDIASNLPAVWHRILIIAGNHRPPRLSDRYSNRDGERNPKADPDPAPIRIEAGLDVVCNQVAGDRPYEEDCGNDGRDQPSARRLAFVMHT